MPTMTNPETGETMEMSMEELLEAMREGKVTVQQQVHHADGTVTSSVIYGNDVGDGIDRSLNVFGTVNDLISVALQKVKRIKETDENAFADYSDDDIELLNQYLDKIQARLLEKYEEYDCARKTDEKE